MWKIEQALERILGKAPAFMRPPYGDYNNLVREVAKQRNQSREFFPWLIARPRYRKLTPRLVFSSTVALWDFDSQDVNCRLCKPHPLLAHQLVSHIFSQSF